MIFELLYVVHSFAAEPAKVPAKDGYEVFELGMTKQPKATDNSKFKISTGCKSKDGISFEKNDSGYENCLREAQATGNRDEKNKSSPSVNLKMGD